MTSRTDVAQMIDHTLLKPEATPDQVAALAKEAGELGTYSICVSPNQLPVEVPAGVHVATVVGFPSGAVKTEVKAAETARAVKDGAEEIDMVVNLSQVKSHDYAAVEADIKAVRDAAPAPVIVKVIIESAALDDEEIVATCQAAERAGADFVKTSTGFHPAGGASVHAVKLMADTVEGRLGVKASGGIRDAEAAQAMIDAGATRLGLSSSAAVLEGFEA
ncbi:deoxyribose-phosphate aldolase [Corynebacterium minutissimum]|uniref:Deoxyribose-phosphate aldolase n=1 Tax=Corynebacterium minutissimum TaxID=38301 RepID=A0A376D2I5_9CORY|nr:deoxyribose-phosphate aldolase [Corynebacterium minutissimum]QRP61585.1 deoxyribose-phosphate aldolase [Corynebacterium minutissimum]STC80381.1 deoxyribose-phosphate aldolase [Corynebacterium minutissimum]